MKIFLTALAVMLLAQQVHAQETELEKLEWTMQAEWRKDHPDAGYGAGIAVDPCKTTRYKHYVIPPHQVFGNGWRLPLLDPATLCKSCPADAHAEWPAAPEMRGEPKHNRTWGPEALADGGLQTEYIVESGTAMGTMPGRANCEWDTQHSNRRNAMLRRCFGESPAVEHGYVKVTFACRAGR